VARLEQYVQHVDAKFNDVENVVGQTIDEIRSNRSSISALVAKSEGMVSKQEATDLVT